ncbi:endolytic transglycosylase MltG [Streptomyces sp. AK02-01A]|uniref:endolytic transglycosylase MltG n=1 Tax=Streptomyces sp. AK02-01A TaxID=3028648 RepID=UPI0029A2E41E|nr:endolytic transglycosylase MltG [Streptomyces sp. AK02-01A]MDX3852604.1 endolytic transglycosylase MltG [Streptomyces sp. AK02-01A]
MTDYGRGPGSAPWHPEDPLYGDQGWGAQQPADGHAPYGGQPQQQYPQQQQPQTQGQYGAGQDPYQQPYQQPRYDVNGVPQHGGQPGYNPQQYSDPQQPQQAQAHTQQQHQQHQQQQHQQYVDPQYNGGWDTGQQATMPYAGNPAPPYEAQQGGGYAENQDYYGTPDAFPPPQPPGRRQPEPETEWDADPQKEEEHPFFTGDEGRDDDGEHDSDPGENRRGNGRERRGKTKKKSRNGCACLFLTVVLAGGVGGVGYFGYQFWQAKFGAPPDYSGKGSGSVQVEIPQGAGGYEIAAILVKNGVVKSQGAFVAAQRGNPKGNMIQAGVYSLSKGMSAASAVTQMLKPSSRESLIIPEGTRNVLVYKQIDKRLGLPEGTTQGVAKDQAAELGLPAWAKNHPSVKDPLEGFLYPASYPVAKGTKPEAVLKKMVARANAEYGRLDLAANAKRLGLENPWELVTVASLVQAEGKTHEDFRKMAEVVYNRLKPTNTETNQLLQFDSAFNYLKGQSKIAISESEINSNKDKYNTYTQKGLTPGPIGNPGNEALAAALDPTEDGWLYFVATDGKHKTEFAKTYAEFQTLKEKFNDRQGTG